MTAAHPAQVDLALQLYHGRAGHYEDSWHPDYSERLMQLVPIEAGQRVLVLACGTGLEAILAAAKVGDEGTVVGVDATPAMLDIARSKQSADPALRRRLQLIQHDVTDLTSCSIVEVQSFDWIICSNAFVLFHNHADVVQHWRTYLRSGGRMVIDIVHENAFQSGLFMERVAKRLDLPSPSKRAWITSKDVFSDMLQTHGFVVDSIRELEMERGKDAACLDASRVDEQFGSTWQVLFAPGAATDEKQPEARRLFRQEWEAAVVDGKIEQSNFLYVYFATMA